MSTMVRRRSGLYVPRVALDAYGSAVMADSPLAYWRLDETSGSTAADSSGSGHAGTYTRVTQNQASLLWTGVGACGSFSGAAGSTLASYVDIPQASWMELGTFTAECLFNTTNASNSQVIFGRDDLSGSASTRAWVLYINSGTLKGSISSGGSIHDFTAGGTIVAGSTYHVVYSWDGTNVRVYLNGVKIMTFAPGGSINATSAEPLRVGCSANWNFFPFGGKIDEFSFYGSALSDARVYAHYLAAFSGYDAAVLAKAPVRYYKFDESSGTTLLDYGTNGSVGTGVSSPTLAGANGWAFNGSNQRVDLTVTGLPVLNTKFTVEAIVKPSSVSGAHDFVNWGTVASNQINGHELIGTEFANYRSGFNLTTTGAGATVGTWYHYMCSYDQANLTIWINGVQKGTVARTSNNTGSTYARLGSNGGTSNWFAGNIRRVAVYSTALTATDAAALAALAPLT